MFDRRALIRGSVAGVGTLLAASSQLVSAEEPQQPAWTGSNADIPSLLLKTMVFQSKRLDASTEAYRKWYIEEHGVDYMQLARHLTERYARSFVEKTYMGPVDFDCCSELAGPSHAATREILKILDSPEGRRIMGRHPKIGTKPGPNELHNGGHRFSVDERLISGSPRTYDPDGSRRQLVLMRKGVNPEPTSYLHALNRWGSHIAIEKKDSIERLILSVAAPEPNREAPIYDAVFVIWPKNHANLVDAFRKPPGEVVVSNVIDVVCYEPNLGSI